MALLKEVNCNVDLFGELVRFSGFYIWGGRRERGKFLLLEYRWLIQ